MAKKKTEPKEPAADETPDRLTVRTTPLVKMEALICTKNGKHTRRARHDRDEDGTARTCPDCGAPMLGHYWTQSTRPKRDVVKEVEADKKAFKEFYGQEMKA